LENNSLIILGTEIVIEWKWFIVVFACLGFLSPANRGSLMTCAMVLYVCLGTPAGYVSARIYKSMCSVYLMFGLPCECLFAGK
jgi:hypothetical protein